MDELIELARRHKRPDALQLLQAFESDFAKTVARANVVKTD
jgi:hypothetical protein